MCGGSIQLVNFIPVTYQIGGAATTTDQQRSAIL
ncbi:hypothetical protein PM8797T_20029 [Gimesia maris DSM 8797]|nr:hypothetical protein PM8797T_20029 [Gimesia maris DSM 8797]